MSETCDCGRPALPNDHFCKECREEFDDYIFKEMVKEAIEEQERLEQDVDSLDRAKKQATAYMAAHSACEASKGVMFKCCEVGFLSPILH